MIYLLVDDVAGRARLDALASALGDASTVALNTTAFDGSRLEMSALKEACEAMPFLSERRLVIVRGLAARPGDVAEAVSEYLPTVPPTTELVLIEPELPTKSPLLHAAERLAKQGLAEIVRDLPLDQRSAVDWVRRRVGEAGGRIDSDAALALVGAIGAEQRVLDREIDKLVLYADGRSIRAEDVADLVPAADDTRVFALVDAIGSRNARAAIQAWRNLTRAGEDPHRLLSLIARQMRLLLQASDLDPRRAGGAARDLGLPPRVAAGVMAQLRNWSPLALEAVVARLVAIDRASKTGGPDLAGALEGLIAELVATRRSAG